MLRKACLRRGYWSWDLKGKKEPVMGESGNPRSRQKELLRRLPWDGCEGAVSRSVVESEQSELGAGGEMGRSLIAWDLWDPAKSLPRSLVGILGPFLLVRKIKLGRVKWHAHGQIKIRTHYQNIELSTSNFFGHYISTWAYFSSHGFPFCHLHS